MALRNFEGTLRKAIQGDDYASQLIIEKYMPLIRKNSIVDGVFDEDCMQHIMLRFVEGLRKFKIKK